MRRTIALLTAATLSGCGLTDGPNRTGSAWLDSLDLGPEALRSVTVPVSELSLDTIFDPGAPDLPGKGVLSLGRSDAFGSRLSLWVTPSDTTRWTESSQRRDSVWVLELSLATSCPSGGSLGATLWDSTALGTVSPFAFLAGADLDAPATANLVGGACRDDSSTGLGRVRIPLDSTMVLEPSRGSFGVRFDAPDFPARQLAGFRLIGSHRDTLLLGIQDGRTGAGAWVVSYGKGSLAGMNQIGTRVRIRFDDAALRRELSRTIGGKGFSSDSFDNTWALFSARVGMATSSSTPGLARRLRLASWVVRSTDTTIVAASGADRSFATTRPEDGRSMEGEFHVRKIAPGLVRIALTAGSDSIPLLSRTSGNYQYSFLMFQGDSLEVPMYQDPGWTKFRFHYVGDRIFFVRDILAAPVAADDQIESVDGSSWTFRDEAVVRTGSGRGVFEARSAFGRILNEKRRKVFTDLYSSAISSDTTVDGNFRIDLPGRSTDSVTFLLRRRSLGVVP